MPDLPFPIIRRRDAQRTIDLLQDYMRELYEQRIGGARLGDVFSIPMSDILTLNILESGGLYKVTRTLGSRRTYLGQTIYLAIKPGSGIRVDGEGVHVDAGAGGYWKHFFFMGC
jgi:hypothetical protein